MLNVWHLLSLLSIFPLIAFARLEPYDFSNYEKAFPQHPPPQLSFYDRKDDPFIGVNYDSGYVSVRNGEGELFYWYFPSDNETSSSIDPKPFLVWLTGGPGCSSELAALTENGPLTIQPDVSVTRNPFAWSTVADIVYVDQPLGTGFSIAAGPQDYATNEKMIARDMREFLIQFVQLHPELRKRPFFITGESYAGHYIPSVAHLLLKSPVENLDFRGIAIGNGWVDPRSQYAAYADFAYEHQMIGDVAYRLAQEGLKQCGALIDKGQWILALLECNSIVTGLLGKKNPYDVRLDCEIPPMCYNTTALDTFMNDGQVQFALGVKKKWTECNPMVYALLLGDWVNEMRTKVGELLEANKQVLIYSGDQDFICNWRGGEAWVDKIEWNKREEFVSAPRSQWLVDGKAAGEIRSVDNLAFLRIYDAGHMVPMDQPRAALSMITSFVSSSMLHATNDEEAAAWFPSSLFEDLEPIRAVS